LTLERLALGDELPAVPAERRDVVTRGVRQDTVALEEVNLRRVRRGPEDGGHAAADDAGELVEVPADLGVRENLMLE